MNVLGQQARNIVLFFAMFCGCSADLVGFLGRRKIIIPIKGGHSRPLEYSREFKINIRRLSNGPSIYGYNIELANDCKLACRTENDQQSDIAALDGSGVCHFNLSGYAFSVQFDTLSATEHYSAKWTKSPQYSWSHYLKFVLDGRRTDTTELLDQIQYVFEYSDGNVAEAKTEICTTTYTSVMKKMIPSLNLGSILVSSAWAYSFHEGQDRLGHGDRTPRQKTVTCERIDPVLPQTFGGKESLPMKCVLVSSMN